jgi:IS1 family transposase
MNRLAKEKRVRIVAALVEGCSIRATCRMTGASKNTVLKLLADIGTIAADEHHARVRGLTSKRIQVDEIWSFCGMKQRNVPEERKGEYGIGDVWTWTAIDADTKLVPSYLVGLRDGGYATAFIDDLEFRLANRVQLTSDGHKVYLEAVEDSFGADIDYAMLIKMYDADRPGEARYSPAAFNGIQKRTVTGNPDPDHVSTSYIERQNLTMRMSMRRFTRLTNAFSKKVENLEHAVALHFFHYNFIRIHQSLRVTPAMEAGISEHVWEIGDLVDLLIAKEDAAEAEKGPRRTRGSK